MQEQASIIGNRQEQEEKNPIDDLLKRAGKDKVIDAVVKGEAGQSFGEDDFFKRFVPCAEAEKLIRNLTNYSHLNEEKKFINNLISTNALLAVAYNLLGRRKEGKEVLAAVENKLVRFKYFVSSDTVLAIHTARDTGLMPADASLVSVSDNAILAFAYSAFGRKEDAKKLIKGIEEEIGFEHKAGELGMLVNPVNDDINNDADIRTMDNALLTLAYLGVKEDLGKFRPLQIIRGIATKLPYDKETGLFGEGVTESNAALAIACIAYEPKNQIAMASGKDRNLGSDLIRSIETHIGFDKETGLVYMEKDDNVKCVNGTILLALGYMARTYDQRIRLKKIADEVLEETKRLRMLRRK